MSTKLEGLLDRIAPHRQLAALSRSADEAMNTFPWESAVIEGPAGFEQTMTNFYHHTRFGLLGLPTSLTRNDELEYGLCRQMLSAEYGDWSLAYEYARTGMRGGLYAVCKVVARQLVDEHFLAFTQAQVSEFWHGSTPDELITAANEYVEKYGHLWPPDIRDGQGLRLKANLIQVLAQHPFLIRRLGELGR